MLQSTTWMEPALYCLPGFNSRPFASVLAMAPMAETLGMFGFDTFETLESGRETAREVGTFKNARVAAQDVVKATSSGQKDQV